MHHAAERSSLDMLALLLNIRTNEGETPLYLVCLQLLTRANYLLSDQARVSRRSDSGFEDHEQARLEIYVYLEVSSHFLIENCDDLNIKEGRLGCTPLHELSFCDMPDFGGISSREPCRYRCLKRFADTPLRIACEECNFEVAKRLIECGANWNIRGSFGNGPMHPFCFHGCSDCEFLIKKGTQVNKGLALLH